MTELPRLPSKPRLTVFNVDESEMNVSHGQRYYIFHSLSFTGCTVLMNKVLSQGATCMSVHDTYADQWWSTLEY
ncbi:unnamed protein product [Brugia pahangi]|uniref:Ricin B-type lectin domain-containing protein n=1 Tax=Brugia pahangi TaxID=6280 RepID=A0A0N4TU36_BRUPA|nr:unnamed protein product [Brugia pahangi]